MSKLKEEKNKIVLYQNDFVDEIIFDYDKRALILFLFLVYKFQNSSVITASMEEIKEILNATRKENKEIDSIVKKLYNTAIYYKSSEEVKKDSETVAKKDDYIQDHIFDILVFSEDGKILNFKIKDRYKRYFVNLKDNFSRISIDLLKGLNSTQILLYLYFNRWKNYDGDVESNWDYFKANMGFSKGYRNNDIIRTLDKAIVKIKEETGMEIRYELIRSQNKREILKIVFKINSGLKGLKRMLKSEREAERKYAKIMLRNLEKNKWEE